MPRAPRSSRWLLAALSSLALIALLDVLYGEDVLLTGTYLIAPLVASVGCSPRRTAAVGAAALALATAVASESAALAESDVAIRLVAVAVGGAFAAWAATVRERALAAARVSRRLAVLGQADTLLAQAGDVRETLRRIASLPVPDVATWSVVHRASADGAPERLAEVGAVPRTLAAWLPDAAARAVASREAQRHPSGAAVVLPLQARGAMLGALAAGGRRLDDEEAALMGEFAARCALALDNAALVEEGRAAERRLAESFALLDTFFERAPVGLAYFDRDGRFRRINDRLAAFSGKTAADLIGRPVEEAVPELGARARERIVRVLATGAPVVDAEMRGAIPADPAVEREWLTSFWPVRPAGTAEVIGVGAVVLDITERKRAERRAALLAEAGAVFDASLDEEATAFAVARVLAREHADHVVVILQEPEGGGFRRAGWAARTPRSRRVLEEAMAFPLDQRSSNPIVQVARIGRRRVLHPTEEDLLRMAGGDAERARILHELGPRTSFLLPLRVRGRLIGALAAHLERVVPPAEREEKMALLADVAARAALAIDNARLYSERAHVARTLQQSLLPPQLPEIPGAEIAARYRPAGQGNEVGGDFYDCFETGAGTWAVLIGDVCGKGAEAAAVTALARYTLRAAVFHADRPATVLAELNAALLRQRSDFRFCTVGYAALGAREGGGLSGCFASGGHPLPIVLRADGRVDHVGRPGTLLGIVPDVDLPEDEVVLAPGDALVLFTDGVIEASPLDDALGPARLGEVLQASAGRDAEAIADALEAAVLAFGGRELRDDVAIVVVRALPAEPAAHGLAPADEG